MKDAPRVDLSPHVELPPVPQLPGGPDPAQPVPRSPVEGVDLPTYARISAELAEAPAERARVLSSYGLDEIRWMDVERTWLLRVATAALKADLSLGQDLDLAYAAAQAALGPPAPAMPLEDYARLAARIEAGEPPGVVLAGAGLSLAAYTRLQRAWTARLAADPALARTYRAMVAAARPGPDAPR
ncbi:hypothetical protein WMF45_32305 [Sorangium sp. So ce448]|uniref:hypothetical protein n=1 Tax=Sorangium sp. So ce448 TaxID=3133314 RepID=UPI003F5FFAD2